MTDEDLTKLVDKLAAASGYGGLGSSTMYGEFALDVAKAVREECAVLCEQSKVHALSYSEIDERLQECANRIRGA